MIHHPLEFAEVKRRDTGTELTPRFSKAPIKRAMPSGAWLRLSHHAVDQTVELAILDIGQEPL